MNKSLLRHHLLHHFCICHIILYMSVPAEDAYSGVDLDWNKILFNSLFHVVTEIALFTFVDLKQCFVDDMYVMVYLLTKLHKAMRIGSFVSVTRLRQINSDVTVEYVMHARWPMEVQLGTMFSVGPQTTCEDTEDW
jgi:hypothetical protein